MGRWGLVPLENHDAMNRGYQPGASSFPWNLGLVWTLEVWNLLLNGAPEVIRTPGLLIRSQTLYPAELRAHSKTQMLERPSKLSQFIEFLKGD